MTNFNFEIFERVQLQQNIPEHRVDLDSRNLAIKEKIIKLMAH